MASTEYLSAAINGATLVHPDIFHGTAGKIGVHGGAQWAVAWTADADGFLSSYCNHSDPGRRHARVGMRSALLKGIKDHAERMASGQARDGADRRRRHERGRLHGVGVHSRAGVSGTDQGSARDCGSDPHRRERDEDPFDHWLAANPAQASRLSSS